MTIGDSDPSDPKGALRIELALLGACSAVWLAAVLAFLGVLPVAGLLPLDLYRLYAVAAVLGWVAGNVYMLRRGGLPGPGWRKRLLMTYLVGPPGAVYLLRALAPAVDQIAAPFVPFYSLAIYGVFFLVPVTLRAKRVRA